MPAEYYILLKDRVGVNLAYIDDYLDLAYINRVNEPGVCRFTLDGNSTKVSLFTNDCQVEIYRRNPDMNIAWYADFYGLFKDSSQYTDAEGRNFFSAECPGQMSLLARAANLWPAGTANRSTFSAQSAETIMKTLVQYNLNTTYATTGNGRKLTWQTPNISIETDSARGNSLDWNCAWKNVLGELQGIGRHNVGGGDFNLVKTGAATWEFRYYPNQLGTDRSASITFSQTFDNMGVPSLSTARANEATIALIGGRGEGASRATTSQTGVNYNAATNYIETFLDIANATSTAMLQARGKEILDQMQARSKLKFKPLQTPSTQYGRDYFLGDLVKAAYQSLTFTLKVMGVSISYRPGGTNNLETVEVDLAIA